MNSLASRHGSTTTFTLVIITQQYNMEESNRKYIINPAPFPNSNLLNEFVTNLTLVPYYATVPTWCKVRKGTKLLRINLILNYLSILDKIWLSFPIFNSCIAGSTRILKLKFLFGCLKSFYIGTDKCRYSHTVIHHLLMKTFICKDHKCISSKERQTL